MPQSFRRGTNREGTRVQVLHKITDSYRFNFVHPMANRKASDEVQIEGRKSIYLSAMPDAIVLHPPLLQPAEHSSLSPLELAPSIKSRKSSNEHLHKEPP